MLGEVLLLLGMAGVRMVVVVSKEMRLSRRGR